MLEKMTSFFGRNRGPEEQKMLDVIPNKVVSWPNDRTLQHTPRYKELIYIVAAGNLGFLLFFSLEITPVSLEAGEQGHK